MAYKKLRAFHKTVQGNMHIQKGLPCEDASGSFSLDDGWKQYAVAAVADGHGSSACFRSGTGSKIAVEAAIECLKVCANTMLENRRKFNEMDERARLTFLQNPYDNPVNLRQLTDAILARWYDGVMQDLRLHPITPEEKREHPEMEKRRGNLPHIYGTTLIAALWLSPWLILLQQGDGHCDVFYEDKSVEQPIPWDERCQGNITTSMCDLDAAVSIRSCLINSAKRKPIACFLESDGVEDAYRDTEEEHDAEKNRGAAEDLDNSGMGGVNIFNKAVIDQFLSSFEKTDDAAEKESQEKLEKLLNDVSARGQFGYGGSGDDASIAGIVNTNGDNLFKLRNTYRTDVELYEKGEKIFWLDDALRSKTRKLGILEQRRKKAFQDMKRAKTQNNRALYPSQEQAFKEADQAYRDFREEYERIQKERNESEKERDELKKGDAFAGN